jgi:hypothetical protein
MIKPSLHECAYLASVSLEGQRHYPSLKNEQTVLNILVYPVQSVWSFLEVRSHRIAASFDGIGGGGTAEAS